MTARAASRASYVDAYRKMREGTLYLIIAFLLIGVGGIAALLTALPTYYTSAFAGLERGAKVASALTVVLLSLMILLVIGSVIGLIGLWGKFVPGVRRLAELNPEFGTSSTLIYVGLFWGTILMIIGAVLLVVLVGVFVMVVAAILTIIGYIGLIMLGFRLNDLEKNSLYLAAGILFVIGIFVPIVGFIAWILLYVALGESIKKAEATPAAPTTPASLSSS